MMSRARFVAGWLVLIVCCLLGPWVANAQEPSPPNATKKIYLIGNSLTWDCVPAALSGEVAWHVDCGKNLPQIFDAPDKPCIASSKNWNKTLSVQKFDYLCVQPHYGTVLSQDVRLIDQWMQLQPQAVVVIHAGWARQADRAWEFTTQVKPTSENASMVHSPSYIEALTEALRAKHPGREIRTTGMVLALQQISEDIAANRGPLKSVSELYRDAIHMNLQAGRYLAHNLLRKELDQPRSTRGFQLEPELQNYLDATMESLATVRRAAERK